MVLTKQTRDRSPCSGRGWGYSVDQKVNSSKMGRTIRPIRIQIERCSVRTSVALFYRFLALRWMTRNLGSQISICTMVDVIVGATCIIFSIINRIFSFISFASSTFIIYKFIMIILSLPEQFSQTPCI